MNLVANQKKVLVEKLADKFQKKQMFFKAECCAHPEGFIPGL